MEAPAGEAGKVASEQKLVYAATLHLTATPFRAERMARAFLVAVPTVMDYGASGYSFYRSDEDSEQFEFISYWDDKADFKQWWYDQPMQKVREQINGITELPLFPHWHTVLEQS